MARICGKDIAKQNILLIVHDLQKHIAILNMCTAKSFHFS